jgi:phage replication O-like protein O
MASGFTKVPNWLLDRILNPTESRKGGLDLNDAQIKVLLMIIRETSGWHRDWFSMSAAQIGKLLGRSRRTIAEALGALRDHKMIEVEVKEGTVARYRLTCAKNCIGAEANCTGSAQETAHPPVQQSAHPYKEERKSKRNSLKKTSSSKQNPAKAEQAPATQATAATDDEALLVTPSAAEAESERGWTPEILTGYCRMMEQHRGEPLDVEWAGTWLCKGSLNMALAWWIGVGRKLKPKKPRYGLYRTEYEAAVAGRPVRITWAEEHVLHAFKREYGLLTAAEIEAERAAAEAATEESRRVAEIERQAREQQQAAADDAQRRHIAELEAAHAAIQAKHAESAATIQQTPKTVSAAPPTPDPRVALERRIGEYRTALTVWASYPEEIAKIHRQIAEMEAELANV